MIKRLFISFGIILTLIISAKAQPQNIMISDVGNPNEPSIIINSKNPALIMAGANLNNLFISQDTGRTWTIDTLVSKYVVFGDPALISDTTGDFFYLHLSNCSTGHWIDRIVCQKYDVSLQQWTTDTFMGLNSGPNFAQDKQWIAIDRTNNTFYVTWTQFDKYASHLATDSSIILFSKSTDGGTTWSNAIRINKTAGDCIDSDNTVEGAVPCVGPNGEIYVSWAGPDGLVFDRSTDGGTTWLQNDISVAAIPGGWDYDVPGINRCNGLPITDCDLSGGPYHGTIYINWSDQRNGLDNTDIWLAKSTDGGNNWSAPIRVNNDTTQTHQFFTWMDIDQSTGYLYFVYYDRQDFTNDSTHVSLAISKDGGQTFENYRISETPFLPQAGAFFGDYTNISVQNGIVRPIWTRFDYKNFRSVWTALINPDTDLSIKNKFTNSKTNSSKVYPNPSNKLVFFSYTLKKSAIVSISVIDQKGSFIARLIDNKKYSAGKYLQDFDVTKHNLKSGVYYFQFSSENDSYSRKFIIK